MVKSKMRQDKERVKNGLKEAITLLCKTGLQFCDELCVEGLLGITLDKDEVFLVSINEIIRSPFAKGKGNNSVKNDHSNDLSAESDSETSKSNDASSSSATHSNRMKEALERLQGKHAAAVAEKVNTHYVPINVPKPEVKSSRRPRKQERPFLVVDCEDSVYDDIEDDVLPIKVPKIEQHFARSGERRYHLHHDISEELLTHHPPASSLPSSLRKLSGSPLDSRHLNRSNSSSSESNNVNKHHKHNDNNKTGNHGNNAIHDSGLNLTKERKDDPQRRTPDSKPSTPSAAHSSSRSSVSTSEIDANAKAEDLSMKPASQANIVTVTESPSSIVMVKKEHLEEDEEESMSGHERLQAAMLNMNHMAAGLSPYNQMALQGMAQVGHPMQSHLSALQAALGTPPLGGAMYGYPPVSQDSNHSYSSQGLLDTGEGSPPGQVNTTHIY
jgi:hypothetical protein